VSESENTGSKTNIALIVGLAVVGVLAVAALALALTGKPADEASDVDAQLVGKVWQGYEFEGSGGTTAGGRGTNLPEMVCAGPQRSRATRSATR